MAFRLLPTTTTHTAKSFPQPAAWLKSTRSATVATTTTLKRVSIISKAATMTPKFADLSMATNTLQIDDLLNGYCQIGYIDRERAISKIRELRITNSDIRKATTATLPFNTIPFNQASNSQLAGELNAYRAILAGNYLRNTQEEPHANT